MTIIRPLLAVFMSLMGLLVIECVGGRLFGLGMLTPAVGALMAMVVAVFLMHAGGGAPPTRLFLCFGAFWLAVLLGLGMVDPVTRVNHPAPSITLR